MVNIFQNSFSKYLFPNAAFYVSFGIKPINMKKSKISRRNFLGTSAAATA